MATFVTKFNIGDRVETLNGNVRSTITQIIYTGDGNIKYRLSGYPTYTYREYELTTPRLRLSLNEIQYLESICSPFRWNVKSIMKKPYCSVQLHIEVSIANKTDYLIISLPIGVNMFSALEANKNYTIEELGLFHSDYKVKF